MRFGDMHAEPLRHAIRLDNQTLRHVFVCISVRVAAHSLHSAPQGGGTSTKEVVVLGASKDGTGGANERKSARLRLPALAR
jgi:hypothetical protein